MQYKGVVPSRRAFASVVAGVMACSVAWAGTARAAKPVEAASFAEFDRRARAGEELTVVFFGASLTWGANATDQALTSYRACTKDLLEARYPKARFRCYDAAIGGTGSQLGAFRLDRDVLSRKPDLVFLDFSANDDNWKGSPLAFASYESLLRRIIRDGRAPVVAVMFPFKWEIGPGLESGTTAHLKGLSQRMEIAAAYGAANADAAALIVERVRKGEATLDSLWDTDGVHPGDLGYRLFAEAAFAGFEKGVRDKAVCRIPEKPLHEGPFMSVRRAVLADLFPADALPAGWAAGKPLLTGACHDQMMSRWLGRLLIASNRKRAKNAEGKEEAVSQKPATLRFEVRASYVMLFGEATMTSGKYRVIIDGKPHSYTPYGAKEPTDLYDMTSSRFNGNWNYHQAIVDNLDPSAPHVLEIEPVLDGDVEQELRIESVCVAGGPAEIKPLPPSPPPAAGSFRETRRLGDIVQFESDERVAIDNGRLRLEFDKATGDWVSLFVDGVAESLVAPAAPGIALDFRVDQRWMVEEHGAKLLETTARSDEASGSLSLEFRHGVHMREPTLLIPRRWRTSVLPPTTPPQDPYEFELISRYTIFPNERRVERSATLNRNPQRDIMTPSFRRLEGFLFVVPNAAVGPTAECVVDVPGPVYTYNHVEPRTPYPSLASTFVECRTAPDRYPGIVGVTNETLHRSLATWLDTKAEVYYQTYLSGDRRRISILMHDVRCSRMGDSDTAVSDRQVIFVGETFPEAQAEQLRTVVDAHYPREANTPDWVPEMAMIEVMPSYYEGGLRGLAERIPFYREIGFNTLYMLPHWLGGYDNVDPFAVDPNVGSAEDLRHVVKVAHDNGMRVLFDMVIHGFSKKSPVVREHPEFFTRDEHGLLVTHFNWGTYNTDPSNPAYIDYMRRLVQHDAKTYGIDGYRVDANSYKSPNWDSGIDHPAWKASSTLPLYRAMMEAMREIKPDAVLMSEMFGPVWHSVSNLAQDANWANVTDMNAALESGKVTAASYKAGIASLQKSLPPGSNRIRFCRNHDTSWFLKTGFSGYTPRLMALEGVHALAGIFVAFAGDPKHPPSPDDDPAVWEYYRNVLRLRKDSPEFARGELLLDEIVCDDPHVMSFIRRLDGKASLVLANFAGEPRRPGLSLHLPGHSLEGTRLVNPQTGAAVSAAAEGKRVSVPLAPFEVVVGRLD